MQHWQISFSTTFANRGRWHPRRKPLFCAFLKKANWFFGGNGNGNDFGNDNDDGDDGDDDNDDDDNDGDDDNDDGDDNDDSFKRWRMAFSHDEGK